MEQPSWTAMKIWDWLGSGREVKIEFGAKGGAGKSRPWIFDPTNDNDNIVGKVLNTWYEVEEEAEKAFETIMYAREAEGKGRTRDLWKEVVGPRFNIDEEE